MATHGAIAVASRLTRNGLSVDVAWSSDNGVVAGKLLDGAVNLVGGTAWFWTRADVAQAVDVLVVDEAGQCGLPVMSVEHEMTCVDKSQQEADVVVRLWHSVQGSTWRHHEGIESAIGPEKVLVVAPYNAQVGLIKAALLSGARVGTVDKFQGQEAPLVIYSMTSSSADDAPRGVSFLYDLNRLNVAVSRAQALAVVVLSPALLDAPVRTPEQLRRVNALCRMVESACVLALGSRRPRHPAGPGW
jgi:hypothetical protein